MLEDVAICLVLTIFGGALGMDKSHNKLDYVGPALILIACLYAFWVGLNIFAGFLGAIFLIKLLLR